MNRVCNLLGIKYPIIQAGMVWCSGWRLASAVSNAGGLGVIGAGSMSTKLLSEHILKCKAATNQPFGINVPLMYARAEEAISMIIEHDIKVIITSAGNPQTFTKQLKDAGVTVLHVVSSAKFALKAVHAGVDAVIGEGFEAGGHNGREETTTMCLIPALREQINVPIIAAGGIGSGRAMLAAMALGADGVQIGTRFAVCEESSAHTFFKEKVISMGEGDTLLSLKKVSPVRLVKNQFFDQVHAMEASGASETQLTELLGKGRARRGMFEGDLKEGELEIGQVAAQIKKVETAGAIMTEVLSEFEAAKQELTGYNTVSSSN